MSQFKKYFLVGIHWVDTVGLGGCGFRNYNIFLYFFLHLCMHSNLLLIVETSLYLENCHFGCGYK